jgi:hypothetical protein
MTRDEARAALKRQFAGLPVYTVDLAAYLLGVMDEIEDDGDFVESTHNVMVALKLVESLHTGFRPAPDMLQ